MCVCGGRPSDPGMDQHPPCGHSVSAAQYELTTSWQPPDNAISAVLPRERWKGPQRGPALHTKGNRVAQWGFYVEWEGEGEEPDEIKTERRNVVVCQHRSVQGAPLLLGVLHSPFPSASV